MECMPNMRDEEYGMYAQNEGRRVWNIFLIGVMKNMECMPNMRDEEYGMYAQNEG